MDAVLFVLPALCFDAWQTVMLYCVLSLLAWLSRAAIDTHPNKPASNINRHIISVATSFPRVVFLLAQPPPHQSNTVDGPGKEACAWYPTYNRLPFLAGAYLLSSISIPVLPRLFSQPSTDTSKRRKPVWSRSTCTKDALPMLSQCSRRSSTRDFKGFQLLPLLLLAITRPPRNISIPFLQGNAPQ